MLSGALKFVQKLMQNSKTDKRNNLQPKISPTLQDTFYISSSFRSRRCAPAPFPPLTAHIITYNIPTIEICLERNQRLCSFVATTTEVSKNETDGYESKSGKLKTSYLDPYISEITFYIND